jgi:hypothetical protein
MMSRASLKISFSNRYKDQSVTVASQMSPGADSDYARKMIRSMMEIQDDILKIPELSSKQKHDIMKLRQRLDVLNLQTDDTNIKLALINVMNSII